MSSLWDIFHLEMKKTTLLKVFNKLLIKIIVYEEAIKKQIKFPNFLKDQ